MSRLSFYLTALWLISVAAQPSGFVANLKQTATDVKDQVTSEVQAGLDPVGKTLDFIGGDLCKHVKPIAGVAYEDYDKEPDMSKLTLVFMTSAKTVIYNLTTAPEEFPRERWFNSKLPLKIYLHGFIENPKIGSFQTISRAFFAQEETEGPVNILALDASSLIAFLYLRATTMVQFIGEKLGKTLAALVPTGLDPQNIHLIGHSLGSHIAGFTAKTFFEMSGSRIGRISSLDPAGPCFSNVDPTLRLSKEDANFLDVMHTNAGVFGLDEQIGHVDFWPNGGAEQPNCLSQTCSHNRAWELFAESVKTPQAFLSVKCNSYNDFRHEMCDYNDTSVMGYGTPANTRGMYYCQTRGKEPFAAGDMGLTYNDTAIVKLVSNAVKNSNSNNKILIIIMNIYLVFKIGKMLT